MSGLGLNSSNTNFLHQTPTEWAIQIHTTLPASLFSAHLAIDRWEEMKGGKESSESQMVWVGQNRTHAAVHRKKGGDHLKEYYSCNLKLEPSQQPKRVEFHS